MAELAGEGRFRTETLQTPVSNTLSYASVLGYAAVDALKAYAHHLRHPDLLVWAPFVAARAGLDAAGFAFWLVEPGIGVEGRVQRGLTLRLHNARQQMRAPADLPAAGEDARAAIEDIRSTASTLGWKMAGKKKTASVGASVLPTPRAAIHSVLAHRQAPGAESAADPSWWFYSGLTHAAPYALMQFIASNEARPTGAPGVLEAPIYISGPQLVLAAGSLGRALLNLADGHGHYLGLPLDDVHSLDVEFAETVLGMLGAMERAQQS